MQELYTIMGEDLDEWSQVNICVASFCRDGDLLSQWRAYGFPGAAYAIGFDSAKLAAVAGEHQFVLAHCRYRDPGDYQEDVLGFIKEIIAEAVNTPRPPETFIGRFLQTAATMKLACFREEDEWRIVSSQPVSSGSEKFNLRARNSMLIPYYAVPLDSSSIVEIIVGPCAHPELAKDAAYGLCHRFGLDGVWKGHVETSRIPYRNY